MRNYNPEQIRAGRAIREKAQENGEVASKSGGAAFSLPSPDLDYRNQTRMAGPGGAFAVALMDDPELQDRVGQWGYEFEQTAEGRNFYGLDDMNNTEEA